MLKFLTISISISTYRSYNCMCMRICVCVLKVRTNLEIFYFPGKLNLFCYEIISLHL